MTRRRTRTRPDDKRLDAFSWWFLLPGIIAVLAVIGYPMLLIVVDSVTDARLGVPDAEFVGLANYRALLSDGGVINAFVKSVALTAVSVPLEVILALLAALALHRKFRSRWLVHTLLVLPWPIPTFMAAFTWVWLLNYNSGAVNATLTALNLSAVNWLGDEQNALLSVILASTWKTLPWTFLTIASGLSLVSDELLDAARVDGASMIRETWHIVIPSTMPVLIPVVLLRTVWTFNHFELIYLMTGGGPGRATRVMPIELFSRAFVGLDIGKASAIGATAVIILSLAAAVFLRIARRNTSL